VAAVGARVDVTAGPAAAVSPSLPIRWRRESRRLVTGCTLRTGPGPDTYRSKLSGMFTMDQTYLGPLLAQVERPLADLAE
jgi:hypothetical protein